MKNLIKIIVVLSLLCLCACQTYNEQTNQMKDAWVKGDTELAQKEISKIAKEEHDSVDGLIFLLEQGAISRANNDLSASVEAFDKANKKIEYFENEAKVRLGQETAAILTNQSFLDYEGYNYDKIMLGIYQSLNFIELKNFEYARVWLKKLEFYQQEAQRINQDKIDDKTRQIQNAKLEDNSTYNTSKTLDNKDFSNQLKQLYGQNYDNFESLQRAKNIYLNPFAYWLGGVFFANKASNSADKAYAYDMFKIASNMLGNNSKVLLEDLKMANNLKDGSLEKPTGITYIIYETGLAPVRDQKKINLPLFIFDNSIPQVSMNFPFIRKQTNFSPRLNVKSSELNLENVKFDIIANMDDIIEEEFNGELKYIITKTIISAATKALSQYALTQTTNDPWAKLAINLSASIYQTMMNDADLRTWHSLPKQIKIARFETPSNGEIYIEKTPITLNKQGVNVILVRKMIESSNVIIRTFDFQDK